MLVDIICVECHTGAMLTTSPAELPEILKSQRAAALREGPPTASVRIDRLDRAIGWLVDNETAIIAAIEQDFGRRSPVLTRLGEIAVVIAALTSARENVARWMSVEERKPNAPLDQFGAKAQIHYHPLGVVGIIAPWNTPVRLIFQPLCGVIAAGNRAIVKPSELTPTVSDLLVESLPTAFSPDEVAVIAGGFDVGDALARLPLDHLVFTGGEAVAREVMAAAATHLVPVTLELGGKSPVIIGRNAAPELTADRIATGKLTNAGQACIAPDYILAPADEVDAWADRLAEAIATQAPSLLSNPEYTAIINDRHADRVRALVDDAREHSDRVIEVNPANEDLTGTTTVAPTIVVRPTADATVVHEEIFGPVLPILPYENINDAISYVNSRSRPLALYFIGEDADEQAEVLNRTISGGVTLGDVMAHTLQDDLPFGGIGASGTGNYRGIHGFRRFSHARSVYTQTELDIVGLAGLRPPFDQRVEDYLQTQIVRPAPIDAGRTNALLDQLPELLAADGEWNIMARGWTGALRISMGDAAIDLALSEGQIAGFGAAGSQPLDSSETGVVTYQASDEVWAQILAEHPAAPFHDAFSAQLGGAELGGHVQTSRQYYPAVRRAVDLMRIASNPALTTTSKGRS